MSIRRRCDPDLASGYLREQVVAESGQTQAGNLRTLPASACAWRRRWATTGDGNLSLHKWGLLPYSRKCGRASATIREYFAFVPRFYLRTLFVGKPSAAGGEDFCEGHRIMTIARSSPPVVRPSFLHYVLLIASIAAITVQTACSTTEGFGNDVKKLGGNIEDSAARNK